MRKDFFFVDVNEFSAASYAQEVLIFNDEIATV